ncbi:hypothetical protein RRG08_004005 [Elysia crispata]|uniref:Uncharacterized protein n=1 Tax=Elysia crispata TaxID=231223 RepID=A0AAE0Y6B5_9GAST|nr:hypothetical protein RRG08_004005 [Elysia crispata]
MTGAPQISNADLSCSSRDPRWLPYRVPEPEVTQFPETDSARGASEGKRDKAGLDVGLVALQLTAVHRSAAPAYRLLEEIGSGWEGREFSRFISGLRYGRCRLQQPSSLRDSVLCRGPDWIDDVEQLLVSELLHLSQRQDGDVELILVSAASLTLPSSQPVTRL